MTFYRSTRILRESAYPLTFLLLVEILAGQILNERATTFLAIPFLLILVPVVNGIGGNVGTVLGARLTSGLYTGALSVSFRDRKLLANVQSALVLYVVMFAVLGTFIYGLAFLVGVAPPFGPEVVLFLMLSSGLMLAGVLIVVTLVVALVSFARGLDPDNFVTPVVTTFGDLLGIVFLILVVGMVL